MLNAKHCLAICILLSSFIYANGAILVAPADSPTDINSHEHVYRNAHRRNRSHSPAKLERRNTDAQASPAVTRPLFHTLSTHYFLQLTDLHLDPHYIAGATVASGCHDLPTEEEARLPDAKLAGLYGTPDCDSPEILIDSMLQGMHDTLESFHPPAFIILTGDVARHKNVKRPRTHAEVLTSNEMVWRKVTTKFPRTLVIPTIGNNDLEHQNKVGGNLEQSGKTARYDPSIVGLFEIWKSAIPADMHETFRNFGYYHVMVGPKIAVISLNTLYFFKKNHATTDCNERGGLSHRHMLWLSDALRRFERDGVSVFIIGHIPPTKKYYLPTCLSKYSKIMSTYGKTIVKGQLFGHLDVDDFMLLGTGKKHAKVMDGNITGGDNDDEDGMSALPSYGSFALNSPSILPAINPTFRIYEFSTAVDNKSHSDDELYETSNKAAMERRLFHGQLRDYFQYYADLEAINAGTSAFVIKRAYVFSELYGQSPLTVETYANLKRQLKRSPELYELYKKFRKADYHDYLDTDGKQERPVIPVATSNDAMILPRFSIKVLKTAGDRDDDFEYDYTDGVLGGSITTIENRLDDLSSCSSNDTNRSTPSGY